MFERKEDKTVPVSTVKPDIEMEKKQFAEHLRDFSDNIDRRVKVIDVQIEKADEGVRNSLVELRKKLVREKKKVDKSLKDIEKSSATTWQVVHKKSSEVLTDAKIETQKIEERVEDIIE
jgi:hypothetical protein